MPHISHVQTTFNVRSGSARRTATILRALVARGDRASLLIGPDNDLDPADLPGVVVCTVPGLHKPTSPLDDLVAVRALIGALRELRPDLVHTHLAKAGILGREAARRARVPRIAHTVHGPTFPDAWSAPRRWLYRQLERRAARTTDAIVFVGEELRDSYLAAEVAPFERAHVIRTARTDAQLDYRPLEGERRAALRRELSGDHEVDMLLVAVGRPVPAKRYEHAIDALARLVQLGVDARLVILGRALIARELGHESRLRAHAVDSGVADRVRFAGFVDDVLPAMSAADAVVLTSAWEGLPNAAVEAALAGTPIVAYTVCGLREVVDDRSGRLVAVADVDGLVRALESVRQHPDRLRSSVAARARELVPMFSEATMIDAMMKLYDRLLDRGSAPGT